MTAGRFHAYASNTNSIHWVIEGKKEDKEAKDVIIKIYTCMKLSKNKKCF